MKNNMIHLILVLSSLAASATSTIASANEIPGVLPSVDNRLVLKPLEIVQPRILEHEVGEVVNLRFTVTAEGRTTDIIPLSMERNGRHLSERVVEAVSAWKFAPVQGPNGFGHPVTVEMPITIRNIDQF